MTVIDILLWCFVGLVCAAIGAFGMWLCMRKERIHYKNLYEKVKNEKMELMWEYNRRLDTLGRTMGMDTTYLTFGMSSLSLDGGSSMEYNSTVDDIYE